MVDLAGIYKSKFDNFSIKIVKNINGNQTEEFEFWLVVKNKKEELLYKGQLNYKIIANAITISNDDVKLSCNSDCSIISIEVFPRLGMKGNYTRE